MSDSSLQIKVDDRMLECPVCLELFDKTCKMLPCQHSFCTRCLECVHESNGSINCPTCRRRFTRIRINLLPQNFFLINIVDKLKPNLNNNNNNNNNNTQESEIYDSEGSEIDDDENLEKLNIQTAVSLSLEEAIKQQHLQMALTRSEEDEINEAEKQSLVSEKERLEFELGITNSEKLGQVSLATKLSLQERDKELEKEERDLHYTIMQSNIELMVNENQHFVDTLLYSLELNTENILPEFENLSIENILEQQSFNLNSTAVILENDKKMIEVLNLLKEKNSIVKEIMELDVVVKKESEHLNSYDGSVSDDIDGSDSEDSSTFSSFQQLPNSVFESPNLVDSHFNGFSFILKKSEILAELEEKKKQCFDKKEDLEFKLALLMSEMK